jgi:hypothetical protein
MRQKWKLPNERKMLLDELSQDPEISCGLNVVSISSRKQTEYRGRHDLTMQYHYAL